MDGQSEPARHWDVLYLMEELGLEVNRFNMIEACLMLLERLKTRSGNHMFRCDRIAL